MVALPHYLSVSLLRSLVVFLVACSPAKVTVGPQPPLNAADADAGASSLDTAAAGPQDATLTEGTVDVSSAKDAEDAKTDEPDTGADVAAPPDTASAPQKILFIGNSYTYVNDLPAMTAQFAAHAVPAQTWQVTSVTLGGARLIDHLTKTDAVAQIQQASASWVVLQGQSLEPAVDQAGFLQGAKALAKEVHATKAQLAYYTTWPRKAGDALYAQAWSGGNPTALYSKLKSATQLAADQTKGVRVPVADAWMAALAAHPEVDLYQADGSHPSVAGTYLAACVFARTLAGVDASTVTWRPEGLAESAAVALRQVCQEQ